MKKILLGMAIFSLAYPLRWEFEVVPVSIDRGAELEIDSLNHPHLVFRSNYLLIHGEKGEAGWRFEQVDTSSGIGNFSFELAFGIYPSIVYSIENVLRYAQWNGREWKIEEIDKPEGGLIKPIRLRLDGRGYPHILYRDNQKTYNADSTWGSWRRVRYTRWNVNGWESTTLDSVDESKGGGLYPFDMALDNQGQPHICGSVNIGGEEGRYIYALFHLFQNSTGWHRDTITMDTLSISHWSPYYWAVITTDPTQNPLVIFDSEVYGSSLYVARKEGNSWDIRRMDEGASITCEPRWDREGRLHITYRHVSSYWGGFMIKYAIWDGDTWAIDTVYKTQDILKSDVYDPSLAIDREGYSSLAFTEVFSSESGVQDTSYYVRGLPEGGIKEQREKLNHPELIISPNPVKGVANIRYETPVREAINLSIYDATGRLVKTLVRAQNLKPGVYTIKWDERDAKGKILPSGIYFIKLVAKGITRIKKVILMR